MRNHEIGQALGSALDPQDPAGHKAGRIPTTTRAADSSREIEMLPPEALKAYARNARTHSKKQIRQIADSIKEFGFCNPVLIDGNAHIIAGHGRVAAAKLLGLTVVPTVRLSHLSEAQKRAYVLADNRLAEKAGWDRDTLAIELQALVDLDFEVELTGFETAEIELCLEEAREASGESGGPGGLGEPEDAIPASDGAPAVSRSGDLWVLGRHRLLCGDPRTPESYTRLLGGMKAHFVFADPLAMSRAMVPTTVPGASGTAATRWAAVMTPAEFLGSATTIFKLLAANSTEGSIHQVCADWRHMVEVLEAGRAVHGELAQLCVWTKSTAEPGAIYDSAHQLIFVWRSGAAPHLPPLKLQRRDRSRSNVWDYPALTSRSPGRPDERDRQPSAKPVALVADAIKDCCRHNDLILDPFAGSGTVLIAAERTGRRARAIEIDPHSVDLAVRRWEAYTGKAAVLEATGQTFEEAAERDVPPLVAGAQPSVRGV
jgi:DNA methylase/ParB-like nuclease domain